MSDSQGIANTVNIEVLDNFEIELRDEDPQFKPSKKIKYPDDCNPDNINCCPKATEDIRIPHKSMDSYLFLRHIDAAATEMYDEAKKKGQEGNYYFWKNLSANLPVYDRPNWDASLRVDVNLDQKWSLYSDNRLEGTRLAHTTTQDVQLPMVIDLNIGAQYDINRWLNVYLQLGNYLHRKNPIYYGYTTQGCHFLAGVKYIF